MPQAKKKAPYERRLDAQIESVNKLHAGYPSTHRRIPETISKFIVDANERRKLAGTPPAALTPDERETRDSVRAHLARLPRRK